MDPEQIKEVFNKFQDFGKPKLSPIFKLLGTGLANLEGEKWKMHRKIINPAFHLEKLKVIHIVHSFMMSDKTVCFVRQSLFATMFTPDASFVLKTCFHYVSCRLCYQYFLNVAMI